MRKRYQQYPFINSALSSVSSRSFVRLVSSIDRSFVRSSVNRKPWPSPSMRQVVQPPKINNKKAPLFLSSTLVTSVRLKRLTAPQKKKKEQRKEGKKRKKNTRNRALRCSFFWIGSESSKWREGGSRWIRGFARKREREEREGRRKKSTGWDWTHY